MNCAIHLEVAAIATCCDCGSGVCQTCRNKMFGRNYCDVCAARLEDKMVAPRAEEKPTQVIVHQQAPRAPVPYGLTKHPGLAAILSIFWPGIGQIYAGRVGRGLAVMFWTFLLTPILIGVFIWFWQIFDAANIAREENDRLMRG